MQRPQSTENDQLPGQKQHFLNAYLLVSSDKHNKKTGCSHELAYVQRSEKGTFCVNLITSWSRDIIEGLDGV